jgi:hypothetical protein
MHDAERPKQFYLVAKKALREEDVTASAFEALKHILAFPVQVIWASIRYH